MAAIFMYQLRQIFFHDLGPQHKIDQISLYWIDLKVPSYNCHYHEASIKRDKLPRPRGMLYRMALTPGGNYHKHLFFYIDHQILPFNCRLYQLEK